MSNKPVIVNGALVAYITSKSTLLPLRPVTTNKVSVPYYLTWESANFNNFLSPNDNTLQEVFDKIDAFEPGSGNGGLATSDINTLAKINSIIQDANLVD